MILGLGEAPVAVDGRGFGGRATAAWWSDAGTGGKRLWLRMGAAAAPTAACATGASAAEADLDEAATITGASRPAGGANGSSGGRRCRCGAGCASVLGGAARVEATGATARSHARLVERLGAWGAAWVWATTAEGVLFLSPRVETHGAHDLLGEEAWAHLLHSIWRLESLAEALKNELAAVAVRVDLHGCRAGAGQEVTPGGSPNRRLGIASKSLLRRAGVVHLQVLASCFLVVWSCFLFFPGGGGERFLVSSWLLVFVFPLFLSLSLVSFSFWCQSAGVVQTGGKGKKRTAE